MQRTSAQDPPRLASTPTSLLRLLTNHPTNHPAQPPDKVTLVLELCFSNRKLRGHTFIILHSGKRLTVLEKISNAGRKKELSRNHCQQNNTVSKNGESRQHLHSKGMLLPFGELSTATIYNPNLIPNFNLSMLS